MEGKGAVGTYPGGLDCSTSPVMRLRYAVARWEAKCSPMTTSDPDAALVLMQGPIGRCSAVTMYLGSHFARQKARSVMLNITAYDEHGDDAALTMQPVPRSLSKDCAPPCRFPFDSPSSRYLHTCVSPRRGLFLCRPAKSTINRTYLNAAKRFV